jgi:quinol monooxygenase YgiN
LEEGDAWRREYDGFAPIQAEHGVHGHQVLCSVENPNDVIVTHTFEPREAASAFFAMPELKEAMSKAGVNADSVEISYFDEVESGSLVGVLARALVDGQDRSFQIVHLEAIALKASRVVRERRIRRAAKY